MKIKLYIVTYNNESVLNETLNSLFKSHNSKDIVVTIINNHSNFKCNHSVNVIHNSVRPDFSTGHLSRDWNCAIINGFKDLNNPDCDILITCQDDTAFTKDWLSQLIKYHETYNFISAGWGDAFCSYLPDAITKVGLWDERFNSIQYQEADYFNRQKLFNGNKCSINDFHHNRILNNVLKNDMDKSFVYRSSDEVPTHRTLDDNFKLLNTKYTHPLEFTYFSEYRNKQNILYPYFESKLNNLDNIYYSFT